VRDFVPNTENWIKSSELVVSMGGYNTVYEALSLNARCLVVPRIFPRKEQLIRAEILSELGLLEMIHPDKLTSVEFGDKVKKSLSRPRPSEKDLELNFNGLENAIDHIKTLLH
jgi:predicted glycosyltransferase